MIRSATQTELISSPVATPGAGAPGEGVFTVEADRQRLGPVMLKALQRTGVRVVRGYAHFATGFVLHT